MSDHRPERPVLPAASHAFDWKSYLSLPGLAEGRRFSLYVGALVTGTYISSPFFDIYMLTVLKFDYTTWSILVATQTLAKIFFYTYWGKVVDRFGNRAVLFGTGLLIPAIALFWVFSPSFWWLFFAQIFSGMAWAGFDLASFNYTLSMPDPPTRTAQSAAYSFSKGSGMLLGTLIGGILLALWPRSGPLDPSPFLAVFFISAMARYLASAYFLPRFSAHAFEGRMTGNQFLWEVLAVQPGRSMGRHLMDVSESTMRLAQTGTVHTMWAAEKLGELSAAGFRHAEAQARRTARSAAALGEVPRHSILAARTLGSKLETSSSNLLQYGDVFVAHLARLLSRVQTEAGRLLHSMSKGAGLKRK